MWHQKSTALDGPSGTRKDSFRSVHYCGPRLQPTQDTCPAPIAQEEKCVRIRNIHRVMGAAFSPRCRNS